MRPTGLNLRLMRGSIAADVRLGRRYTKLRILENRFLMDWAPGLAVIPLLIGMSFTLIGSDISNAADAEINIIGPDFGLIFTVIAFAFHSMFWINIARISGHVGVIEKNRAYGLGVLAIGGLVVVAFVDGGWMIFALAQFGLAYIILKTHLLSTGFGIATAGFGLVNILFGFLGFAETDPAEVPVFAFIGWSLIMLVFSLVDGHPEERDIDYEARFRRGSPEERAPESGE